MMAASFCRQAQALEIAVRAFTERGPYSRSYGALLSFEIDLGATAAGLFEPPERQGAEPGNDASASGDSPAVAESRVSNLPPETVSATELARVSLSPAALQRLIEASLALFRVHISRVESLASRAGSSAWLPELRLRAGHNTDQSLRLTPTDSDPNRYQVSGAADLRLEAQAAWKLHRLVFANDEIAIERLRTQLVEVRRKRMDRVLELLFAWQLASIQARSAELSDEERLRSQLARLQAVMALDALSNGQFSRELGRRSHSGASSRPTGQ